MGDRITRYSVPAVIAFAPPLFFLMTWNAEDLGPALRFLRSYSLPLAAAELFAILVAVREGAVVYWRQLRPPAVVVAALVGLVSVAVATALFVAPAPAASIIRTIAWIIHLFFGLSIAFLVRRKFSADDLIAAYCMGFTAYVALFVIFATGALQRPINWTFDLPSVSHIRHIGIYASAIVGLAIGVMAGARGLRTWMFGFAIVVIGFALSFWTGSRGPVAAVGAAVAFGLIAFPTMRSPRAWGGTALAIAIAVVATLLMPAPADNMGVGRTIEASTGNADATTGRMELWALVLQAISRSPIIGYGESQMSVVAPFYGMGQPHNLVLQLLLAWGVIGLICAAVLGIAFVARAIPAVRADEASLVGPFTAMATLTALSMVDAALYHVLPVSIFAACAGMIAASWSVDTVKS
jgi:O-antigen ligase